MGIKESVIERADLIEDEEIRNLTKEVLEVAPKFFWTKPASSSGKYHSKDENEVGGLALHTYRTSLASVVLLNGWLVPVDKDIVLSAALLHDIGRYGLKTSPSSWSLNHHPQLGKIFFLKIADLKKYNNSSTINKIANIGNCIERHMGKWGTIRPETQEEMVVFYSDMVASQYFNGTPPD